MKKFENILIWLMSVSIGMMILMSCMSFDALITSLFGVATVSIIVLSAMSSVDLYTGAYENLYFTDEGNHRESC